MSFVAMQPSPQLCQALRGKCSGTLEVRRHPAIGTPWYKSDCSPCTQRTNCTPASSSGFGWEKVLRDRLTFYFSSVFWERSEIFYLKQCYFTRNIQVHFCKFFSWWKKWKKWKNSMNQTAKYRALFASCNCCSTCLLVGLPWRKKYCNGGILPTALPIAVTPGSPIRL